MVKEMTLINEVSQNLLDSDGSLVLVVLHFMLQNLRELLIGLTTQLKVFG